MSINRIIPTSVTLENFRVLGKCQVAWLILFTYMFPESLLGIPFFSVFKNIGLQNSLFGLALAHMTHSFPFALWLMWQTFEVLPRDFEQAASIDGASRFQAFIYVACPMVLPSIIAIAIFACIVLERPHAGPDTCSRQQPVHAFTVRELVCHLSFI